MKRIFMLLLTTVLCFALAACGGELQTNDSSAPTENQQIFHNISDEMSAEEKLAAVPGECVGFLRVEINPAFELYLTWDDNIEEFRVLDARPVNEDAGTLFQTMSVANMTLYDALFSICNAAKECGYLNPDCTVKFEYHGQLEGYNMTEILPLILDGYQAEMNVSFSYDTVYTEVIDEDLYDLVERDEDGTVIRTVRTSEDGCCVETCTYDETGAMTSKVLEDKNLGESHWEYYEQGSVVKTVSDSCFGTATETYDSSGAVISEIFYDKENGSSSEKYYVDGILVKAYWHSAGRENTQLFDDNGNMISEVIDDQENDSHVENHWAGDVLVGHHSKNSEYEMIQTFDSKGNMTSQIIDNWAENSTSESYWTYYEDGTMAGYKCTFSGAEYGYYEEEEYYQSGAVSMSYKVYLYGSIKGDNKFYYDENGNPTRFEGKDSYGYRVETVYYPDGSRVSRIYESSTTVRIETWGADGSLTVTYE